MRITKELLKRYGRGVCTEEERKAIEKWLDQPEYPELRVSTKERPKADSDEIWSILSEGRPQLKKQMSHQKARNLVLFNHVTRYAAAACIIIGAFFIGYFTALPSAQADTVKKGIQFTNVLHVYGGDGTYGVVTENRYRVEFEGRLKLYNEAPHPRQIVCGEQEFTLEPRRTYYLSGSHRQASLAAAESPEPAYDDKQPELVGDFSVVLLK
ncbi:MAG: hypothetical protein ACFB15_31270 [Cyclobacteriaceae bacterium]